MITKVSWFEKNIVIAYLLLIVATAFNPLSRSLWIIENSIALLLLGILVLIRLHGFIWSYTAIIIVIIACIMQTIGGYYTFLEVPYGEDLTLFGENGRNNFDRLGHFWCGMLAFPIFEYVVKKKIIRGKIYSYLFIVLFCSGIGAIYEQIEWGIVNIVEYSTGLTYIAKQGDEWDPQIDMFCCTVGSIIGIILFEIIRVLKIYLKKYKEKKTNERCGSWKINY